MDSMINTLWIEFRRRQAMQSLDWIEQLCYIDLAILDLRVTSRFWGLHKPPFQS